MSVAIGLIIYSMFLTASVVNIIAGSLLSEPAVVVSGLAGMAGSCWGIAHYYYLGFKNEKIVSENQAVREHSQQTN
ncbi:MAG: hypothetical protein EOP06_00185 [Proteobacteria bacterium]|nr:MAG: hypothetical protein EOP06_00185 [Pseudomonadota bacterium]